MDAGAPCFRDNVEELLQSSIETITPCDLTRAHVSVLLDNRLPGGDRFHTLHNNLVIRAIPKATRITACSKFGRRMLYTR